MSDCQPNVMPDTVTNVTSSVEIPALPAMVALPRWAIELARQAVLLRETQKHTMILIRLEGESFKLFIFRPAVVVRME